MKKIIMILIVAIIGYMMNSCIVNTKNGKVPPGQLKKHTGIHPSKGNPGKGKKK